MYISSETLVERLSQESNLVNVLGQPTIDPSASHAHNDNAPSVVVLSREINDSDKTLLHNEQQSREVRTLLSTERGGRKKLTPVGREMIGVAALLTSPRDAAAAFGVDKRTASLLAQGRTASSKDPDPELKARIEESLLKVRQLALDKMSDALSGITEDKLENKDAKELSVISANLGRVVTATNPPKDDRGTNINAGAVFICPSQATESEYPTVEVNK